MGAFERGLGLGDGDGERQAWWRPCGSPVGPGAGLLGSDPSDATWAAVPPVPPGLLCCEQHLMGRGAPSTGVHTGQGEGTLGPCTSQRHGQVASGCAEAPRLGGLGVWRQCSQDPRPALLPTTGAIRPQACPRLWQQLGAAFVYRSAGG